MACQRPPAYVSLIQESEIVLSGDVSFVSRELDGSPYYDRAGANANGDFVVDFDREVDSDLENTPLIELCRWLAEHGVLFGEDFKQLCAPAEFMRQLQSQGELTGSFKSIAWFEPGEWRVRLNEPDAA